MSNRAQSILINTASLRLDSSDTGGLLFEKELIYVGDFEKREDDLTFTVTEADIDAWVAVGNEMLADGEVIPFPLGHNDNPALNRADALEFYKKKDSQARIGLFVRGKWRDEEAKKLGLLSSNQVSIFSPASWTSGRGKTYPRPIKHIAITNDPVIGGLESFKPLVLSLTPGKKAMTIADLAKAIGIEVTPEDTDETLSAKIVEAFQKLGSSVVELEKKLSAPDPSKKPDPTQPPDDKPVISASMLRLVGNSRRAQLQALVATRAISPAAAKKLEAQFCTDDSLTLSLSSTKDDFEAVIDILKSSEPIPETGEKTSGQDFILSKGQKNPLVTNAESRGKVSQPC